MTEYIRIAAPAYILLFAAVFYWRWSYFKRRAARRTERRAAVISIDQIRLDLKLKGLIHDHK